LGRGDDGSTRYPTKPPLFPAFKSPLIAVLLQKSLQVCARLFSGRLLLFIFVCVFTCEHQQRGFLWYHYATSA
jgi:hypothetical protein